MDSRCTGQHIFCPSLFSVWFIPLSHLFFKAWPLLKCATALLARSEKPSVLLNWRVGTELNGDWSTRSTFTTLEIQEPPGAATARLEGSNIILRAVHTSPKTASYPNYWLFFKWCIFIQTMINVNITNQKKEKLKMKPGPKTTTTKRDGTVRTDGLLQSSSF